MAAAVHVVVLTVLLSMLLQVVVGEAQPVTVHAVFNETSQQFQILEGVATESSLAWAQVIDSVNETGWGYLEVSTQYQVREKYNDSMLAYAAGLVEGYVTRDQIKMHWQNTMAGYCDTPYSAYCQRLHDFLETNLNWIRTSIKNNTYDTYWHQVEMFYTQLRGMTDGYNNDPQRPSLDIDPFGLYLFQISNDVGDLEVALHKPGVSVDQPQRGRCSAYIKVDLEYELLYAAHNTWSGYRNMLRMLKKYTLQYGMTDAREGLMPNGTVLTFSSYPGYLISSDDFYVLSSWLFVLSFCYSYNNQWMIVDQKLVQGNLPPAVLSVVEQMPGYIEYADVTDLLIVNTYWASYNVAFFPTIFNMSGQNQLVAKYGDYFSYNMSRRARMFFQQDAQVQDRSTLFNLMRYNDFRHDNLSKCNCTPGYSADLAIAARDDLNEENGTYLYDDLGFAMGGAIDVKIVATGEMQWLLFYAVSGPTSDQQQPFDWSKVKDASKYPHFGQPDLFNFKPVSFNGTLIPPTTPSWYRGT